MRESAVNQQSGDRTLESANRDTACPSACPQLFHKRPSSRIDTSDPPRRATHQHRALRPKASATIQTHAESNRQGGGNGGRRYSARSHRLTYQDARPHAPRIRGSLYGQSGPARVEECITLHPLAVTATPPCNGPSLPYFYLGMVAVRVSGSGPSTSFRGIHRSPRGRLRGQSQNALCRRMVRPPPR